MAPEMRTLLMYSAPFSRPWRTWTPVEPHPPSCLDGGMTVADQNCDGSASIVDITLCIQLSLGMTLDDAIDEDGDQCHNTKIRLRDAQQTECTPPKTCSLGTCECPPFNCLIGPAIDTNGDGCNDACQSGGLDCNEDSDCPAPDICRWNLRALLPCEEKPCGDECTLAAPTTRTALKRMY